MKKLFFLLIFCLALLAGFYLHPFFVFQESYNETLLSVVNPSLKQKDEIKKPPKILEDLQTIKSLLMFTQKDFLEANLQEMKIRSYHGNLLKTEVPILRRGNPQEWGGTPAGLYQTTAKYRASYSAASEVYMPYAIQFYGKYLLHGEPYYPKGGKFISDFSGGCIQMLDKDAETIYGEINKGMPILVIDKENDNYDYRQDEQITEFPEVSAKNYLIADLDSGFIFAEKNPEEKTQIASLTKLMTAVVVSENNDLRKSILIKDWMLEPYGSTQGLVAGKKFGLLDLFYPLLIEPSNDAAEILSYFLGKERSVQLMNEKARSILMENTAFVDSHGFSPENISTAHDLFFLARYILNVRPPIWEITKGNKVPCVDNIKFKGLENKNLFFKEDNFIGGKTGYITASGHNGIFLFKFITEEEINRNVAIILLGSENLENDSESLKKDAQKIIDWLKENYFK